MGIMPGAVWRPITIPGGNPGARVKGRGVVLHVAASEATSLFGFFNNNPNANSHFYVNKAGVIEQYVDTALQSWASMAANKNTISVETQGGVTNPDGEPWTPEQVAALGRICAWAHATEGIPLQVMPNSLPGSKGIGYHRLGIDPWRIAGGEVWSGSRGKLCPGAAKIAQIPAVIAAALKGDDMPLTQQDYDAIAKAVWQSQGDPNQGKGIWIADRVIGVDNKTDAIATVAAQARDAATGANTRAGEIETILNTQVLPAVQKAQTGGVTAADVVAALKADPDFIAAIGSAVAAALGQRVANG